MQFKTTTYHLRTLLCIALSFFVIAACNKPVQSPTKYIGKGPFRIRQEKQQLFEQLKIEYTDTLKFSKECQALAKLKPEDYSDYKDQSAVYNALTKRYGAAIAQKEVAPSYICYVSDKIGYGVFADKDFKQGDFIAEYTGTVVKNSCDSTWTWSYPPGEDKLLGNLYSLAAGRCGNESRFVNHSDDPNLNTMFVFQGNTWHLIYVAKKAIKKDEELLVSYGSGYWKNRTKIAL